MIKRWWLGNEQPLWPIMTEKPINDQKLLELLCAGDPSGQWTPLGRPFPGNANVAGKLFIS